MNNEDLKKELKKEKKQRGKKYQEGILIFSKENQAQEYFEIQLGEYDFVKFSIHKLYN